MKHFFDEQVVRGIAADLARAHPAFARDAFVADCLHGLHDLELLARGGHIADAMRRHLPEPFDEAADVIRSALGPELVRTEGNGFAPFRYLPHVSFVQRYGIDHFDAALQLQYELTKRFTAEWSIRPYLERYPERTLDRLRAWAKDSNVHVRRLVSEGTRPRLPWAPRLQRFIDDPSPTLELLELLKDDPERYVQRSVANHLNDVAKDHPDLAVATCRRWAAAPSAATPFVVRHALRSLVKQGHRGALGILGVDATPRVRLSSVRLPASIRLGEELRFGVSIGSTSADEQALVVDYALHFVKANGETRPKVFKLKRLTLAPHASVDLAAGVSFAQMSTRRHHPGAHRLEILINGVVCAQGAFEVRR